jgi:hypothetical protein
MRSVINVIASIIVIVYQANGAIYIFGDPELFMHDREEGG